MNYIFKTTATMKEYNSKKWYIDGGIVSDKAEFDKGDYSGWSTQYIDLWVTILTVVDTVF